MSEHKIERLSVHIVNIPAKSVHSHGSGDVGSIRSVLLELVTDTGITGWGEASPWPVFTGTAEANAAALNNYLRPQILGQNAVRVETIIARASRVLVGHSEAFAALETALLDLAGQIAGLSVSDLLGGRQRDVIPLSFSVANPDFDADLADVEALFEQGVRLFKLKTGFSGHGFDLMRLERLRLRFGDEISLRIDYNQGLRAFDAIRKLRDIETFNPAFIEQPVERHQRGAMAEIARALDTPLMADESVFDVREAIDAAATGLADIFSLKIMKSGGIRRCLEIAAIARARGIAVYGGCMFETSIAHAAGTHLMAAVPELTLGCEFYMSTYYAADDIAEQAFPVSNGQVEVPRTAGLGVRPDMDKLRYYRIEHLAG